MASVPGSCFSLIKNTAGETATFHLRLAHAVVAPLGQVPLAEYNGCFGANRNLTAARGFDGSVDEAEL